NGVDPVLDDRDEERALLGARDVEQGRCERFADENVSLTPIVAALRRVVARLPRRVFTVRFLGPGVRAPRLRESRYERVEVRRSRRRRRETHAIDKLEAHVIPRDDARVAVGGDPRTKELLRRRRGENGEREHLA